jgi:hypothetical protein
VHDHLARGAIAHDLAIRQHDRSIRSFSHELDVVCGQHHPVTPIRKLVQNDCEA